MTGRELAVVAVVRGCLGGSHDAALDGRLASLIEKGRAGADVGAELEDVLRLPGVRELAEAVRADPCLRPPDVPAMSVALRQDLPGRPAPVPAARFVCPVGDDFTWFRQRGSDPVPKCPTHGTGLVRRDSP